jgi:hypothetical protein
LIFDRLRKGSAGEEKKQATEKSTYMMASDMMATAYSCHDNTSRGVKRERKMENNVSPAHLPSQAVSDRNGGVWNQIRRTEEELMERGTIDNALLREHSVGIAGIVRSGDRTRRRVA